MDRTVRRGFTLVELLTILAIVALVTGFSLAAASMVRARARDDRRVADLKMIQETLEIYRHQIDQSTDDTLVYPYPTKYFYIGTSAAVTATADTEGLVGTGIYPASTPDDKTQDGDIQPNYRKVVVDTPNDPIRKVNYKYFAPACIRPGQGTIDRPVIVTPAKDGESPAKFRQRAEIEASADLGADRYCPQGSGWVPYALYVLLERPITGQLRESLLTSFAHQSDRAVVYAPAQPIFATGESNDQGGYGTFISGVSFCYPARYSICPNGYEEMESSGSSSGAPGANIPFQSFWNPDGGVTSPSPSVGGSPSPRPSASLTPSPSASSPTGSGVSPSPAVNTNPSPTYTSGMGSPSPSSTRSPSPSPAYPGYNPYSPYSY